MNVGSLFSGVGGLDLGLERAGMRIVWQCESDPFRRAVLRKHWPGMWIADDIRYILAHPEELPVPADLICGGFPCQPVSCAGKRGAQTDARWLWPEFARVVRLLRPRYILVENVPGLLGAHGAMGDVLGDLAALGYDAEWTCVAASSLGAWHRRNRVFVAATSDAEQVALWDERGGLFGSGWARAALARHSDWWAAEPRMARMVHGIPRGMDRRSALGDAVVPQVAELIGMRIVELDIGRSPCTSS